MVNDRTGQVIRGYELHEMIGEGGFGAVYRATQQAVGREVAVKIILPEYANRAEFIRRFEAEARLVARLEHLHIVSLYDYWRDPSGAYLVLRWLRGGTLSDSLREDGAWSPQATSRLLNQIAAALSIAHRNNVVHRDVKPANILLDEEDNAYLSDFGIALDTLAEGGATMRSRTGSGSSTADGGLTGSAGYISPEQINMEKVTPRSDIYSMSVVLYEMLTGDHPYSDARSAIALFIKHTSEKLPVMQNMPEAIDAVIQRGAAKDPADRYESMVEMAQAFRKAVIETADQWSPTQGNIFTETWDSESFSDISSVEQEVLQNPYKGLHAFQEGDAKDFFGRESLVEMLVSRLTTEHEMQNFLAVVGPSGSGKSSVVKAGLLPAIRDGALPGSENWFIVEMLPGDNPVLELEDALIRVSPTPLNALHERLMSSTDALGEIIREILPSGDSELMLVIDQFEEVFTQGTDHVREHFLESIYQATLADEVPLHVIITLRADFYDRPLMVPGFSKLIQQRTEVVVPLTVDELERAITAPARRVRVFFEQGLAAAIVSEVNEQPGVLPMLQYALTELFEQREGQLITQAAYQDLGGVLGALARRADEIYVEMAVYQQEASRQLFLRLVTLGEGAEDTRRRALQSELISAAPDPLVMQEVIDTFGWYRLLTFDRDPITRTPTVEVAHEALIREWGRLRRWLDEGRNDVRQQRLLTAAAIEWDQNERDDSFLLRGGRLVQFEEWASRTSIALTDLEMAYLKASIEDRLLAEQLEQERLEKERELESRARQRLRVLIGILLISTIGGILLSVGIFNQSVAAQAAREEAVIQADTAVAAQVIAVTQESIAVQQANNAETQVALVSTAQREAQREADNAATSEFRANDNLNLALTSQAQAENNADEASENLELALTARADAEANADEAQMNADEAATARAEAVDNADEARANADTAATAQAEAITNADEAATAQFVAEQNADEAATAQFVAQNEASISRSLALAASADRLANQDSPLALALAIEAYLNDASLQAQRVLISVVFDAPRRRFENPAGNLTDVFFLDTESSEEAVSAPVMQAFTGDAAGRLTLWDVGTGDVLQTWNGHDDRINRIAVSPDGTLIATASEDSTIILWNRESGEILHRLTQHTGPVNDVDFNTRGSRLVSGSDDATVRVWDPINGTLIETLPAVSVNTVNSVAYRPNSDDIVVAFDDAMRYWQPTLNRFDDFTQLTNRVTDIAFSPDGSQLLTTGGGSGVPVLWDVADLSPIRTLPAHIGPVNSVTFSPDGTLALTASDDFVVIMSEVETGTEIRRFAAHTNRVLDATFSPDSREVLSVGADRVMYLWDTSPSTQDEIPYEGLEASISELIYLPESRIFSGTDRGNIAFWQLPDTEALLSTILYTPGLPATVYDVQRVAEGDYLILAGSSDMRLFRFVFNTETGQVIQLQQLQRYTSTLNRAWVADVALSPDGRLAAWAGGFFFRQRAPDFTQLGILTLWDTETGELVREFDVIDEVTLVNEDTGEEVTVLPEGSNSSISSVIFTPDGSQLITGVEDGRIIIRDIETGEPVQEFTGHTDEVTTLVLSQDGTQLLSGSEDRAVILWRVSDGQLLRRFIGHTDAVNDVAFHPDPDNSTVLSGAEDGSLRLWDTETGELVQRFGEQESPITRVEFLPGGATVLAGTLEGNVYVNTIDTARNLLDWARDNRYIPELTCSQREQFRVPPLCENVTNPVQPVN